MKIPTFFKSLMTAIDVYKRQKSPSVKWGFLVDDTEGVVQVHLDNRTHQEIKSKSEDVKVILNSLSNDKVYVTIFSTSHCLTYKGEYIFYRDKKCIHLYT